MNVVPVTMVPGQPSIAQPSIGRGNHHVAITCLALMGIGGIIAHVAN
jgi:hypothetical protein